MNHNLFSTDALVFLYCLILLFLGQYTEGSFLTRGKIKKPTTD
jgi:hypothetical protein